MAVKEMSPRQRRAMDEVLNRRLQTTLPNNQRRTLVVTAIRRLLDLKQFLAQETLGPVDRSEAVIELEQVAKLMLRAVGRAVVGLAEAGFPAAADQTPDAEVFTINGRTILRRVTAAERRKRQIEAITGVARFA